MLAAFKADVLTLSRIFVDAILATLRNWEQGRRRPTGPSRALLFLVPRR
jgi:DNA-binding transcriptional regulator YiaG